MLTLLHTADLHLGAKLQKLGPKADIARVQIQKTFEKIVSLAIEKHVQLFLIAGDVFDSQRPEKHIVDFFLSQLAILNDKHIYTMICLGTHDYEQPITSQMVASLPYVHLFDDPNSNSFAIDALSVKVFANCASSNKSSESPLHDISRDSAYTYNIAMAHGSLQIPGKSNANDSPITIEAIDNTNMDYVGLGHWHNQQQIQTNKVKAYYAGSPESIDTDQDGSGSILLVHINDGIVSVESIQVSDTVFESIHIDVSALHSLEDVITKIKEKANIHCICNVLLDGLLPQEMVAIDSDEIQKRIGDLFYLLEIKDTSQISLDNLEANASESILKHAFLDALSNMQIDDEMKKEVLQLGFAFIDGKLTVY